MPRFLKKKGRSKYFKFSHNSVKTWFKKTDNSKKRIKDLVKRYFNRLFEEISKLLPQFSTTLMIFWQSLQCFLLIFEECLTISWRRRKEIGGQKFSKFWPRANSTFPPGHAFCLPLPRNCPSSRKHVLVCIDYWKTFQPSKWASSWFTLLLEGIKWICLKVGITYSHLKKYDHEWEMSEKTDVRMWCLKYIHKSFNFQLFY